MKEAVSYFEGLERAVLIEPDPKNFKRLKKYIDTIDGIDVLAINAAAFDRSGDGVIMTSGNRNSTISATSSFEHRESDVRLISVDDLERDFDFIKYDVEGAEYEALVGSCATIKRTYPTLLVSLYHRSKDIFFLINYIKERYPEYSLRLARLRCIPAWEVDLICKRK